MSRVRALRDSHMQQGFQGSVGDGSGVVARQRRQASRPNNSEATAMIVALLKG